MQLRGAQLVHAGACKEVKGAHWCPGWCTLMGALWGIVGLTDCYMGTHGCHLHSQQAHCRNHVTHLQVLHLQATHLHDNGTGMLFTHHCHLL